MLEQYCVDESTKLIMFYCFEVRVLWVVFTAVIRCVILLSNVECFVLFSLLMIRGMPAFIVFNLVFFCTHVGGVLHYKWENIFFVSDRNRFTGRIKLLAMRVSDLQNTLVPHKPNQYRRYGNVALHSVIIVGNYFLVSLSVQFSFS